MLNYTTPTLASDGISSGRSFQRDAHSSWKLPEMPESSTRRGNNFDGDEMGLSLQNKQVVLPKFTPKAGSSAEEQDKKARAEDPHG